MTPFAKWEEIGSVVVWDCAMDEPEKLFGTDGSQRPAHGVTGSTDGDPSTIGRYRIMGRIGGGGFGRVYLGHDDEFNRSVAIKVPRLEGINRADELEAFLVEAKAARRLASPEKRSTQDLPGQ